MARGSRTCDICKLVTATVINRDSRRPPRVPRQCKADCQPGSAVQPLIHSANQCSVLFVEGKGQGKQRVRREKDWEDGANQGGMWFIVGKRSKTERERKGPTLSAVSVPWPAASSSLHSGLQNPPTDSLKSSTLSKAQTLITHPRWTDWEVAHRGDRFHFKFGNSVDSDRRSGKNAEIAFIAVDPLWSYQASNILSPIC